MCKHFRPILLIALILAGAAATVGEAGGDLVELLRRQYVNRRAHLRLGILRPPCTVDVRGGKVILPLRTDGGGYPAGSVVVIRSVAVAPGEVVFHFTKPDGSLPDVVRFLVDPNRRPAPEEDDALPKAVSEVFSLIARQGSATDAEPPPEDQPAEPEPEEETEEAEEPEKQAEEVRLLVEPGKPTLQGNGEDVTTVTVTARGEDGRVLEYLQGPVDLRASSGKLTPERPMMVNGRAAANLQAPLFGSEPTILLRSLELTALIIQNIQGVVSERKAAEIALRTAKESGFSTVPPDDPNIYLVAEHQGAKGRTKVAVAAVGAALGALNGYFRGKDITGQADFTWEPGPYGATLKQSGESSELAVIFSGGTASFSGVTWQKVLLTDAKEYEMIRRAGGGEIGFPSFVTSLGQDVMYMFAPPILFYRTAPPEDKPKPPEKPKPTVTLVAMKNPIAGDGESATEVRFTYLDALGRPVPGLALQWSLDKYGVFGPSEEGSLSGIESVTDGTGTARATYHAPRLEAKDMQETGAIKNRDVSVDYASSEETGAVTAQIGLLKSAPVRLVVEKPGVERMVLPINLGSLNGTIKGRVLLQVVDYRLPGMPTRLPLQNAKVKLDGDEKILKWAAVDDAVTDEDGEFTVKMQMANWERWDKEFAKPFLVRPSADFVARQFNCLKHLREWPASEAVQGKGEHFVLGAQGELAALEPDEAEGLAVKLRTFGLMMMVLKTSKSEGGIAAEALVEHGKDFLKGVAAFFYADSKLEKWVKGKTKALETTVGLTKIKTLLNKYAHRSTSTQTRLFKYLSDQYLASDVQKQFLGARSSLRNVAIPKMLEALSSALAEWLPEVDLGIQKRVVTALLAPWVEAGNTDLELFLDNDDYDAIRRASTTLDAHLSVELDFMRRDILALTAWRIGEDYLKVFVDTVTECTALAGKFIGYATLNFELVEAMDKLEKVKEKLDTAVSAIRFFAEVNRFITIMEKAEKEVLYCVAQASGGRIQVSDLMRGAAVPGRTAVRVVQAGLLPGSGGAEVPELELADAIDWEVLEAAPRGDPEPALFLILAAEQVAAGWQMDQLAGLSALGQADPRALERYTRQRGEFDASLRECRMLALRLAAGEPTAKSRWAPAVGRLKERLEAFQGSLDDTREALAALPPDPDAVARQELAAARPGAGRPWGKIALYGGGSLALLLLLLVLPVILIVRSRKKQKAGASGRPAGPAGLSPAPAQVPLISPVAQSPPAAATSVGPRLRDFTGAIHALRAECTTVGAERDNLVVLSVPGVSRHHARIWRTADGQFWIEDLGSRNGTYVNGARVEKAWLTPGVAVALGGWSARFEI